MRESPGDVRFSHDRGRTTPQYDLLGGSQRDAGRDGSQRVTAPLAILPDQTHCDVFTSPLSTVIDRYLDAPQPAASR